MKQEGKIKERKMVFQFMLKIDYVVDSNLFLYGAFELLRPEIQN